MLGLTGERRTATVRCSSMCACSVARQAAVMRALEEHPEDKEALKRLALQRLDLTAEKLCDTVGAGAGHAEGTHRQSDTIQSKVEFFEGCNPKFLRVLTNSCQLQVFFPHETIVLEGDEGATAFIIE